MQLPREIIPELVPETEPPAGTVDPFALTLSGSIGAESEDIDAGLLRRSYLWSIALINAGFQALPHYCTHFSAGFVYVDPEAFDPYGWIARARESFLFGGYALVSRDEEDSGQRIESISVGGVQMPLVITPGRIELHGCPPHPLTDSAACWVRNIGTHSTWNQGILTCRHVVDHLALGDFISLDASGAHSSPSSGTLADIDECTIDAAIIEVGPTDWPSNLSPLLLHRPVAPSISVRFAGRNTSTSGRVLRIFRYSSYPGNLFGQRVIADCLGIGGDSGSLLKAVSTGRGVGLYMGSIPDRGGGYEGMYQDLTQAAQYFDLDLFY